jgi:hypothetical protein
VEDAGENLLRGVRFEGVVSGEQAISDGSEGEDVGAQVDALAHRLLRRRVEATRALADRRPGEEGLESGKVGNGQLARPRVQGHDVPGPHVPMDDAGFVKLLEPAADLAREAQGQFPGTGLAGNERRVEGRPAHILLDDEQRSRLRVLAEVEDRNERRVDGLGDTARLLEEARREGLAPAVRDVRRRDDPDHDGLLALGVSGSVDDGGCAAGELLEDLVAPEASGNGGGHGEDLRTP